MLSGHVGQPNQSFLQNCESHVIFNLFPLWETHHPQLGGLEEDRCASRISNRRPLFSRLLLSNHCTPVHHSSFVQRPSLPHLPPLYPTSGVYTSLPHVSNVDQDVAVLVNLSFHRRHWSCYKTSKCDTQLLLTTISQDHWRLAWIMVYFNYLNNV